MAPAPTAGAFVLGKLFSGRAPARRLRRAATGFTCLPMTAAANPHDTTVHIIGAGLAGSEAAWQVASRGVRVVLHEMRPVRTTEAHVTDTFAELVCSNSFRSDDASTNAVGLLHEEL